MNLKTTTLAAAIAMGLMCGTASAQITNSPNPNKAQNSDMRTQSGSYPYAVYPNGSPASGTYMYSDGTYIYSTPPNSSYVAPGVTYITPSVSDSTVWVVPAPTMSEPVAGRRNVYVPSNSLNYTPNPNRFQNNGVPTQYDTWYFYREPMQLPY